MGASPVQGDPEGTAGGAEFYGVYEQVVPDIVEQFFVTGIRDFI